GGADPTLTSTQLLQHMHSARQVSLSGRVNQEAFVNAAGTISEGHPLSIDLQQIGRGEVADELLHARVKGRTKRRSQVQRERGVSAPTAEHFHVDCTEKGRRGQTAAA